jgi:hypothetical protein
VLGKTVDIQAPSGYSGAQGSAFGANVPIARIGNATGVVGFFGNTGIAPIATGGNGLFSATILGVSGPPATGIGNSGLYYHLARAAYNGGSGTPYTLNDLVLQLKNLGIVPA